MTTSRANDSSTRPLQPSPFSGSTARQASGKGRVTEIWLDGGVLACACPDCGAPMSIRLWLMTADCWRCGASVELTEDQQRHAERLLHNYRQSAVSSSPLVPAKPAAGSPAPETSAVQPPPATLPPSPARTPASGPVASRIGPQEPAAQRPPEAPARSAPPTAAAQSAARQRGEQRPTTAMNPPLPASAEQSRRQRTDAPISGAPSRPTGSVGRRRVPAAQVHRSARARMAQLRRQEGFVGATRRFLRDLPAWLVSLVFHAVLMILLGLWMMDEPQNRGIILSTAISPQDYEGEQGKINLDEKAFEFDEPGAIDFEASLDAMGIAKIEPDVAPVDPPLTDFNPVGLMPERAKKFSTADRPAPEGRMLLGRDPALRAQMVRSSGGTSATEAAVARGLKFLARHQRSDGSWSLQHFRTADCDETCTHPGGFSTQVAGTALALLPFLGAGQTHLQGEYQEEVLKGLNALCAQQLDDGDLRGAGDGRMYAHGMAAIVLCEAYALTQDKQLFEPAQRALNYIVAAQHPAGGWRYEPGEPGDVSVVGWQLMALKSGQMAGLHVPNQVFERASKFLDSAARDRDLSEYDYQPGRSTTIAMTAEALLCRQYLGWPRDHKGLKAGIDLMVQRHLPNEKRPNVYYWYYATQVMHHYGGSSWRAWNDKMRDVLVSTQEIKGHAAGSWTPRGNGIDGGFADYAGRIYMTALSLCTLEVYYRHLPLYGQAAIEGVLPAESATSDSPSASPPGDTPQSAPERAPAKATPSSPGRNSSGGARRKPVESVLPAD